MKVTIISNFLNHHQIPICNEFFRMFREDFKFVSTQSTPESRLKMGYFDSDKLNLPYHINGNQSNVLNTEIDSLIFQSDVVIIGSAPQKLVNQRLLHNKLTFNYSERIFKKGIYQYFNPFTILSLLSLKKRISCSNFYLLSSSAFTTRDFSLFGLYKNKSYKWGYFPELIKYDEFEIENNKNNVVPNLLWVGRLINWKHPELAIYAANELHKKGYKFFLRIVGTGNLKASLEKLVVKLKLINCIKIIGPLKPEEVRKFMEVSNIFLFTSDFNEGWGAVLNEAMNSACAVVASHAIGAVPFLIKNNFNGLIFDNKNLEDLVIKIKELLDNKKLTLEIGKHAYKTILNEWNARIASERFIDLTNHLLNKSNLDYNDGPCSKSYIIKNNYDY